MEDSDTPTSVQYEVLSNGQIINALAIHGSTSLYCVSTFNEETEQNWIQVWRRKTLRAEFGPYNCTTLDFKLLDKNLICLNDPDENGTKLMLLMV